jgi:DNA-cytosine methyltransferase
MKTLATLFSGGGGMEAGAVAAGFTPIWGVEADPEVASVYARNFGPHCIVSTVEGIDYSTLQTPFHLHASPSCKKASVANKERGESPEDISAAEATARAIRTLQSPNFSLENVWGYREFESFRIILRALEESGYAFGYWHLNAANYGVPQTRKRLILIASRTHRPRKPQATHSERGPSAQSDLFSSEPLRKWVGWYEAIEDLIPTLPESKFAEWQLKRLPESIKTFIAHPTADCDWFMTRDGDEPVFSILANGNGTPRAFLAHGTSTMEIRDASEPSACVLATVHGKAAKPRAFIVGQNYGSPNDNGKERKLNVRDAGEPIFTVETNPNRLNTRAFLVGGANTSETQAAEGVGVSEQDEPTRCVNASNSATWRAWLSQGRVVSMTPRALARFQSIPNSYLLPEKNGLACKVIGNFVPALLAQRICESIEAAKERAA